MTNLDKLTYAANCLAAFALSGTPSINLSAVILPMLVLSRRFCAKSTSTQSSILPRSCTSIALSVLLRILFRPISSGRLICCGLQPIILTTYRHLCAQDFRFLHVSTDEVYGTLGDDGYFTEDTAYWPRSPYASSKAASDHLVSAFFHTYGLPVVIVNCSNNYGPYQFPEKLIPLTILNAIEHVDCPYMGGA